MPPTWFAIRAEHAHPGRAPNNCDRAAYLVAHSLFQKEITHGWPAYLQSYRIINAAPRSVSDRKPPWTFTAVHVALPGRLGTLDEVLLIQS